MGFEIGNNGNTIKRAEELLELSGVDILVNKK